MDAINPMGSCFYSLFPILDTILILSSLLQALLLKKFSTTQALLAQVVQFRRNLAVEAEISKRLQDGALRVD